MTAEVRDLTAKDFPAVLALNAAHVAETSELTADALSALVAMSFSATRVGGGKDAFLIALDEGAAYDSPNFLWFKSRYSSFVYIDRIVVAPEARGRGLARLLYEDLFSKVGKSGREIVTCEVNLQPPNPGSDAFHAALGFMAAGSAEIHGGTKTVRYLTKNLS